MPNLIALEDRAYAAGIIDGEGSIVTSLQRGGRSVVVTVSIIHTDFALLAWFKERWGGSSTLRKRYSSLGSRALAQWKVSARKAQALLEDIRPYLKVKARQADVALELRALMRPMNSGKRLSLVEAQAQRVLRDKISALNRGENDG